SKLSYISENVSGKVCPIEPQSRLKPFEPTRTETHRFRYSDIDFNGHVNTVRYIEHLVNQFPMQHHANNMVKRLELAFVKETYYDSNAEITINDSNPFDVRLDINADGITRVRSRFIFSPRDSQ
ncbi:MAG: acyl-[Muribaculaceae bacterium]|nr:acyl-[acyl-carrier-protein] thioesterase [Muribaculaceae bacterium]